MKRLAFAALALGISFALQSAPALGVANFRTPDVQTYCGFSAVAPTLICWRPSDGLTVVAPEDGGVKYRRGNIGAFEAAQRTLAFGQSWRAEGFVCRSERTELACRTPDGRDFSLRRLALRSRLSCGTIYAEPAMYEVTAQRTTCRAARTLARSWLAAALSGACHRQGSVSLAMRPAAADVAAATSWS